MKLRSKLGAIAVIALVLALLFVIRQNNFMGMQLTFYSAIISWYLFVLVVLVVAYLRKLQLDVATGPPDFVLSDLAHRLRAAHYRVSESPGRLTVQIGSAYALKIQARPDKDNTVISYQPDLTPTGWSLVIILFFFGYGVLSIPVAVYYALKSKRFAFDQIRPQLPKGGRPRKSIAESDIRINLIDTLSEGHRLAAEASEVTQSSYEDMVLIVATGTMAVWMGIFVLLFWYGTTETLAGGTLGALLVATAVAGTFAVLSGLRTRRSYGPLLRDYRSWAEKLQKALARETGYWVQGEPEASSFELIAEACKEVPKWLEARRRGTLFREPGTSMVIFLLGYSAAMTLIVGVAWSEWSFIGSAVLLAISAAVVGVSIVLYRRMRRSLKEEMTRTMDDWNRRLEAMNMRMERFLREL